MVRVYVGQEVGQRRDSGAILEPKAVNSDPRKLSDVTVECRHYEAQSSPAQGCVQFVVFQLVRFGRRWLCSDEGEGALADKQTRHSASQRQVGPYQER